MQKNILVLPDGTELSSGKGTTNALMNVELKEVVNSGTELTLGSVCCSCLEANLIAPGGGLSISAGTEVTAYMEDDAGQREQSGIFILEKPTRSSANVYKLIAYDRVVKLDIDLTTWLAELKESFPMTLQTFVEAVCEKCGVTLANSYISNGDLSIEYFSPGEVTGRKLIQWAAEIAACFVRATADGKIEFAWYTKNTAVNIAPLRSENADSSQVPYFQGALSYEDYKVLAVEKVQIRNAEDDIGTVWPPDVEEGNTYVISSNMMLANSPSGILQDVAQYIYQRLLDVSYVPCKVSVPRGSGIRAGDIITVTDTNGAVFDTYIMQRTVTGGKETIECSGSPSRGSASALNQKDYKDLEGRILRIKTSVDGITTEVKDASENITKLQQTAGQVSVTAESEQGTLSTTIKNDGTWKSEYVDANGNVLSGIYFDFTEQSFVFKGSGEFSGNLNIGNGTFVVDENGNLVSKGSAEICGGKFYALNDDGTKGGYVKVVKDGLAMYESEDSWPVFMLYKGSYKGGIYPFIWFNSSNGDDIYVIKRFADGLWIGNSSTSFGSDGCFEADEDSEGIFVSAKDKTTYAVSGTSKRSFYTGESVARFG